MKKNLVIAALVVIVLVGCAGFSGLILKKALEYYEDSLVVRLDPLGSWLPPVSTELSSTQPILFFGDSRVAHWRRYPLEISADYVGYSGYTSEQIQLILEDRFSFNPATKVVVLQLGINDLKAVAMMPQHYQIIVDRCIENIERISRRFAQQGATVAVLTLFPTGPLSISRQLVWSDDVDKAVDEVNARLSRMKIDGVQTINVDNLFTPGGDYFKDELHLNAKGYHLLNDFLESELSTLLQ